MTVQPSRSRRPYDWASDGFDAVVIPLVTSTPVPRPRHDNRQRVRGRARRDEVRTRLIALSCGTCVLVFMWWYSQGVDSHLARIVGR